MKCSGILLKFVKTMDQTINPNNYFNLYGRNHLDFVFRVRKAMVGIAIVIVIKVIVDILY